MDSLLGWLIVLVAAAPFLCMAGIAVIGVAKFIDTLVAELFSDDR